MFISKKNLNLIILFIIGVITIAGGYVLYTLNTAEIEQTTWDYWETGDDRRGGAVIARAIEVDKKREFVLQEFNLINPITQTITYFEELDNGQTVVDFETYYLERTGINSFRVKESLISSSTNFSFEEAVEIAKQYDVHKNNPHPDKIINYKPEHFQNPSETEKINEEKERRLDETINSLSEQDREYVRNIYENRMDLLQQTQFEILLEEGVLTDIEEIKLYFKEIGVIE